MIFSARDLVFVDLDAERRARARARAGIEIRIAVAGTVGAVWFADAAAAACFAVRYADLRCDDPAALEAVVTVDDDGSELMWCGPMTYRWPHRKLDPAAVAFLADAVALTGFFEHHPAGALSLHAAALGDGAGVAALIGETTAGKTTTALACARAGLSLYTDERCAILDGDVHPFPRALNIRAGGLALLLADECRDRIAKRLLRDGGETAEDVRYSELFTNWALPPPAPLRVVFVLSGTAERPAIESVSSAVAAKAGARWVHGAGRGIERIARLLTVFRPVRCYRLTLGKPAATARVIADTLHACERRSIA